MIKATENRRSVHKLIFEWLSQAYSSDIYLFVYATEIGKKIVDSSAINLESIVQTFEEVLTYFNLKSKAVLYIIEMLEITGYRIERVESSNTTKIYYKLIKNA